MTALFLARWLFLIALVLLGAGFGALALLERRRR
jgi:hypothetical protein